MVDTRTPERKDGDPVADRALEHGERADGRTYTAEDALQFERLHDALRFSAGPQPLVAAPAAARSETSAFDYSEDDVRAFDRLMDGLGDTSGGRQGRTAAQRGGGHGFGYTSADDDRFAELMKEGGLAGPTAARPACPSTPSHPAPSAFNFTEADNAAFRRILSDGDLEHGAAPEAETELTSRRDRDVGPMRIVDFDKEHARARETRHRANPNIKIRYFD